jgi:hypothetical protein
MSPPLLRKIVPLILILSFTGTVVASAAQAREVSKQELSQWSPRALVQPRLEAIDAQLRQGEWEVARAASLTMIEVASRSLAVYPLAGAVARLALAEAGLGRQEDAVWHWHVALNLDRSVLSARELAAFGPPGELLARNPLRRLNEAPGDLAVARAEDPQGGFVPERRTQGEIPELSPEVKVLFVPKVLQVQVVVGPDGRVLQPVIAVGGAPGVAWEVLEVLRGWRFEPASREGRPVAVFRDVLLRPLEEKPFAALASLSQEAAGVEALLRAGTWEDARRRGESLWWKELKQAPLSWKGLGALLALRALADAGAGDEDVAVCRWQAAQHLDPDLYDADLSPYGKAGALLERNRWGSVLANAEAGDLREPEVSKRTKIKAPSGENDDRLTSGTIVLAGIVNERVAVRQPVILSQMNSTLTFSNRIDPAAPVVKLITFQGSSQALAVSALDELCEWRFQPAMVAGQPVAFQELVYVPFVQTLYGGIPPNHPTPGPGPVSNPPPRPVVPTIRDPDPEPPR